MPEKRAKKKNKKTAHRTVPNLALRYLQRPWSWQDAPKERKKRRWIHDFVQANLSKLRRATPIIIQGSGFVHQQAIMFLPKIGLVTLITACLRPYWSAAPATLLVCRHKACCLVVHTACWCWRFASCPIVTLKTSPSLSQVLTAHKHTYEWFFYCVFKRVENCWEMLQTKYDL